MVSSSFRAELSRLAMLAAAICLVAAGCGRMSVYSDPLRQGARLTTPLTTPREASPGSLWRDHVGGNFMFTDTRARFPGDLLTIVIVENASGDKEASTSTTTDTKVSGSLSQFFGLPQAVQAKNPDIIPADLLQAEANRKWDGQGTTSRKGKLSARLTALVTAVAPNGNLWVEGEKVVAVNMEDQHIVVSGWVRPEDISDRNEVLSTRIGQGRIDYYGVGVVASKQRPGWALQILDFAWPF